MTDWEMIVVGLLMLTAFISGQWVLGIVFLGCACYMLFRNPEG